MQSSVFVIVSALICTTGLTGFAPPVRVVPETNTAREEKLTPDAGCIRLMTEHRLYIIDGRMPTDNTLEAAILCSRARRALCQRAMNEVGAGRASVWGRYMLACKGK